MKKELNNDYNIMAFDAILEVFDELDKKSLIITDENVYNIYKRFIDKYEHYVIKPGEDNKTLDAVSSIYSYMFEKGYNRNSVIVGVGGGIVTDITGYVASTYMRGIKFGFVPTTLLAMVDASIGGKNGVNFNNYKNIIGCFNQPNFIYICTKFVFSLPTRDYNAGFGEILKYAIGLDAEFCDYLLGFKERKGNNLDYIVAKCINIKTSIVKSDEKESGIRVLLNLGHTVAHAIEKYSHDILHGEAVYIGLEYITKYAYNTKYISEETYNVFRELLDSYKFHDKNISKEQFIEYINKDKKTIDNETIYIVVPNDKGMSQEVKVTIKNFIESI